MTGHLLADHGDHGTAIVHFRRAAAIPSEDAGEAIGLSLALARSLDEAGEPDEALRRVEEALAMASSDADTILALLAVKGRILSRSGSPLPDASVERLARCVDLLGLTLPASIALIDARSAARPAAVHQFYVEAARDYGVMDRACDDLIAAGRLAEASALLSEYIAAAPVAHLRELAEGRLAELQGSGS